MESQVGLFEDSGKVLGCLVVMSTCYAHHLLRSFQPLVFQHRTLASLWGSTVTSSVPCAGTGLGADRTEVESPRFFTT